MEKTRSSIDLSRQTDRTTDTQDLSLYSLQNFKLYDTKANRYIYKQMQIDIYRLVGKQKHKASRRRPALTATENSAKFGNTHYFSCECPVASCWRSCSVSRTPAGALRTQTQSLSLAQASFKHSLDVTPPPPSPCEDLLRRSQTYLEGP